MAIRVYSKPVCWTPPTLIVTYRVPAYQLVGSYCKDSDVIYGDLISFLPDTAGSHIMPSGMTYNSGTNKFSYTADTIPPA